ncbi:glutaredoxin-related protein 5, mitochondrial-like [Schistocerca gregaria]|uniref:glutaredoxin-related protein 5, mitochondrial-like n=1 Tax=Schistocerca gregaria TaxID=7010 RepID=UPI00211EB552|nr:glutaredoxin-related protein 5, mitochondrial-like [Schistocerca gregaria]
MLRPKLAVRVYATSSITKVIEQQIKKAPVVVYMKGTPEDPACGFSKAVVEVLRRENVVKYDYYNVLEDDELRQGIKKYSNWPTIPQVYVGGEFLGGCDIILEMHQEGTLAEILKKTNTATSGSEK